MTRYLQLEKKFDKWGRINVLEGMMLAKFDVASRRQTTIQVIFIYVVQIRGSNHG